MKTKKALVASVVLGLAATSCYWAGYVHISSAASGYKASDLVTGLALLLILLMVLAKFLVATFLRGGSEPPSGGGGRFDPPLAPAPIPPSRPTPSELAATAAEPLRSAEAGASAT